MKSMNIKSTRSKDTRNGDRFSNTNNILKEQRWNSLNNDRKSRIGDYK